jgi:hypothetical protein
MLSDYVSSTLNNSIFMDVSAGGGTYLSQNMDSELGYHTWMVGATERFRISNGTVYVMGNLDVSTNIVAGGTLTGVTTISASGAIDGDSTLDIASSAYFRGAVFTGYQTSGDTIIHQGYDRSVDGYVGLYMYTESTTPTSVTGQIYRGAGVDGVFYARNYAGTGSAVYGTVGAGDVVFQSSNVTRMTIDSSGYVGINATPVSTADLTVGGPIVATGIVKGLSVRATGDSAGYSGDITFTNAADTATRSTGTGSIKFSDTTNRTNTGSIKIYVNGTAKYIPYFDAG